MPSNVVKFTGKQYHPCDRFFSYGGALCRNCTFAKCLHPRLVTCSACGEEFVAANTGEEAFDMCRYHEGRISVP